MSKRWMRAWQAYAVLYALVLLPAAVNLNWLALCGEVGAANWFAVLEYERRRRTKDAV